MRNKTVIFFLLFGIFNLSYVSAFAAFYGKWITQGTYDINSVYDGDKIGKLDEFIEKKLILKKNKKAIVKLNDYKFKGTWKKKKNNKFIIYLDENRIENIVDGYVNDEYGSALDYTDVNIDVNKNKIIGKLLSDNTMKCRGQIDVNVDVLFKAGFVEKKLGTVDFNGKLKFTGVKQ